MNISNRLAKNNTKIKASTNTTTKVKIESECRVSEASSSEKSTNKIFGIEKIQLGNTLFITNTYPSETAKETIEQGVIRFASERVMAKLRSVE